MKNVVINSSTDPDFFFKKEGFFFWGGGVYACLFPLQTSLNIKKYVSYMTAYSFLYFSLFLFLYFVLALFQDFFEIKGWGIATLYPSPNGVCLKVHFQKKMDTLFYEWKLNIHWRHMTCLQKVRLFVCLGYYVSLDVI